MSDEQHRCAFYGEHEKDFEHLRNKYSAICKRFDDYREEIRDEIALLRREDKQRWKEHMAYAEAKVEQADAWKITIKDILASYRLEIESLRREFDGDIGTMRLKHKEDIDKVKLDFLAKVKDVENGQVKAVNKVLFVVIGGIILNYVLPKIFG